MTSGVYQILNTVNGKKYVGSSIDIQKRLAQHRHFMLSGAHHSIKLRRAVEKYGYEVFELSTVEECPPEDCVAREQHYIDSFEAVKNGYNVRAIADSNRGLRRSDESKAKMSEAWKNRAPMSAESRKRISDASRGRKHSPESLAKMSEVQKRKSAERAGVPRAPCSEATKAKISAANKGSTHTPETRKRLSEAHTGRTIPPEVTAARRASWMRNAAEKAAKHPDGRVRTKEQDEKMIATRRANAAKKAALNATVYA